MDVIFLIYLSRSFDSLGKRMSYHLCVGELCEHDSILGSLLDLLSVCVRDYMGSRFTTQSSEN